MFNRTRLVLTPAMEKNVERGWTPVPYNGKRPVAAFVDQSTDENYPVDSLIFDPRHVRYYAKKDSVVIGWYYVQPTQLHLKVGKWYSTWHEVLQYDPPRPTPTYPVHDADIMGLINNCDCGEIVATFTISKRGTKYGIKVVQ